MEIKYINGEYKIIGEFDYGFAGKFVNDKDGNGNIKLQLNEDDFAFLKAEPSNSKKVIKKLTKMVNKFQKLVLKNNYTLKNEYMGEALFDLIYSDKPFWEKYLAGKYSVKDDEIEEANKIIFNFIKKNEQQFDSAYDQFEEFFDDSLINKKNVLNVEAYFKKNFKFYDIDLFISSIRPKELIFDAISYGVIISNIIADEYIDEYGARFDKKLEKTFWW